MSTGEQGNDDEDWESQRVNFEEEEEEEEEKEEEEVIR